MKWFDACVHKHFNQGLWLFYVSIEEIKERTKRWDKRWCCRRGGAWNCLPLIRASKGLSWFIAAIDIAGNMSSSITNPSAPQLQEQRWSKFIHLTKIPVKMVCFFSGTEMLSSPSSQPGCGAFKCCMLEWKLAVWNKAGVLVFSYSSIHTFDLCFMSLKPGISGVFWCSCAKYAGK